MITVDKFCLQCNGPIIGRSKLAKYCSLSCSKKAHKKRVKEGTVNDITISEIKKGIKTKMCHYCKEIKSVKGFYVYQRKARNGKSYTSICKECFKKRKKDRALNEITSRRVYYKECVNCGSLNTTTGKTREVSQKCRACNESITTLSIRTCKLCNGTYDRSVYNGYCSLICSSEGKEITKVLNRDRRRALERKARTAKRVVRSKVFNRDKWRCQICGIKTIKEPLKDNSAEIDHIQPLSKGGPHTYSNVQTLCRSCNNYKRAKYKGQTKLHI